MKIGIITFHNALNYGAVLQTYALQKSLQNLGYDVDVINYSNKNIGKKVKAPQIKQYHNYAKFLCDRHMFFIAEEKRKKIERFTLNYLQLTQSVKQEELKNIGKNYDIIFVGSDQVWNDKITGNDDTYYLDFISGNKRCSYAASIGNSEIPFENIPRIKKFLDNFKAISVREITAQKALKEQLGIDAEQVLDPTLLLNKNEYTEFIKDEVKKPYILLYMLMYSDTLLTSARRYAKERNIPLYCINASGKIIRGVEDYSNAGVEEWLSLFYNASFIFTNSFHGVAFSINFEKNFNVELPPARVNVSSRITDILKIFKLEDRVISEGKINSAEINYFDREDTLKKERKKSTDFLNEAINSNETRIASRNEKSVIAIPWNQCSGCGLCKIICPTDAIKMTSDRNGFKHPSVNLSKCIQCGKCKRECPFDEAQCQKHDKLPKTIMAAYSKSSKVVYNSSSGGAFFEISNKFLEKNGKVYGAAFSEDFTLEHKCVDNIKSLSPLMGSKYMQSNAYKVFDKILEQLKKGERVLFVGTPCQVAALKKLCKGYDENLVLVDFVCHGVPSPELIKEHIKYVEKYFKSKVAGYKPRSKVAGWGNNELFTFTNGKKEYIHPVSQAYKIIFYKDLSIRSSCFNCSFTNFDRPGDITIADYWGIEKTRMDLLHNEGLSMIFGNTEKGCCIISSIDTMVKNETSLETIYEEKQPHLFRPLKDCTSKREEFWDDYHKKGWEYVIRKYAECDKKSLIKYDIKNSLVYKKIKGKK